MKDDNTLPMDEESWIASGFFNGTNASRTASAGPLFPQLKTALDFTLVTLLVVIMLAMGCVVSWKEMWSHLKRPIGILIGMCSQFALLPLVGFGLAHALKLSPYHAIGLLVLTCSPGGTTSNIFTYLSEGDVSLRKSGIAWSWLAAFHHMTPTLPVVLPFRQKAKKGNLAALGRMAIMIEMASHLYRFFFKRPRMSVVMTTSSTILALGLMPVNLLIYSGSWTSEYLVVPYGKIAFTLVFILVPVAVGMVVRWKLPRLALALSKVGSVAGMLAILSTIVMQSILYPSIFQQTWQVWFACIALPVLGFSVGFSLSCLARQPWPVARTVAIETGAQNVSLALTVLLLSFPLEAQEDMSIVPILFSIFVILEGFIFCMLYKIIIRMVHPERAFELVQQVDDVIGHDSLKLMDKTPAPITKVELYEIALKKPSGVANGNSLNGYSVSPS